jgi:ribosomal protein S27E
MFKLIQKENPASKFMYIICAGCNKQTSFNGLNCPIVCIHCNEILPDAMDMHYDKKERIVYHQDKEIFP